MLCMHPRMFHSRFGLQPFQVLRHRPKYTRIPIVPSCDLKNYNHALQIQQQMGNIEIKERPRYSIFAQRQQPRPSSRSPFRDVLAPNSPYYKEVSPIRYSPIARDRRSSFKDSLRADTSARKSPKPQEKQINIGGKRGRQVEDESVVSENKEKCQQIIRKVRNFNDFLVELKRKLKEDCSVGLKKRQRSQVSLSVKLQNERVQLQKYKKLVERQLSKTHSIENISIQNAPNGQKILTIQYEDIAQQPSNLHRIHQPTPQSKFSDISVTRRDHEGQSSRDHQQLSARLMEISNNNQLVESNQERSDHQKRLKEAKMLWGMLRKKTEELGALLAKQEQIEQSGDQLRDYLLLQERLVKVTQLRASIESAHFQSMEIEKRIQVLLT